MRPVYGGQKSHWPITARKNPPVHKAFAFRTPEHAVEDGYIRDKEAFASALKAELSRHDIHEKEVVFTLSSSKVVTREVMIPFVKDNKIMGIIEQDRSVITSRWM